MKPKKGEANAEMDEPVKNPLQLVKDLVLLIVEARTPDHSIKGRVEGPHCPVIRGRPVHKCSAEKSECIRASEFCYLAQRLWLNSVPICLDILLFPDCSHGQEEVLVTEGTVTKLSQENALLAERWTIEGIRRRQDDCLSSAMLIQAVRSYLHFSQISSWLYSTGGKLPGLLAYRVYAPGEMTSLGFLQTPDIHNFPVCLANLDHIRVQVSSLQRQDSVPLLVCYYEQAMGTDYRNALDRKESVQKKKLEEIEVMMKNENLTDSSLPVNSCTKCIEATEKSRKKCLFELAPKTRKKSVRPLQEISAQNLPDKEMYVCAPHGAGTSLLPSSSSFSTVGAFNFLGNIGHKATLSDVEIVAKKAKNLSKMKTFSGGDDCQMFSDVLCATRTCSDGDILFNDETLNVHTDSVLDAAKVAHGDLGTGIQSTDVEIDQSFLNEVMIPRARIKNKPPYFDTSHCGDDNKLELFNADIKNHTKVTAKDKKKDKCIGQRKVVLHTGVHEKEDAKQIEIEEYKYTDKGRDVQTLIRNKKKIEYSKFKKSFSKEYPGYSGFQASLELWRVTKLSRDLLGDNNVDKSDGRVLLFSRSPENKALDSLHSRDKSALYNKISTDGKLQPKKASNISEKEANEEELIRLLSDRLALVTTPQEEMFASPKLSRKIQDHNIFTNYSFFLKKSVPAEEKSKTKTTLSQNIVIQDDSKNSDPAGSIQKYLVQDSDFCQFKFGVCNSSDIDNSGDMPVASPNQTSQLKSTSELSPIKYVKEKSIKQRCHWSQKDLSRSFHFETPLQLTTPSSSKSQLQIDNKFCIFADETMKAEELPLQEIQPVFKPNIESQKMTRSNIHPVVAINLKNQMPEMQQREKNSVLQPVNVSVQSQSPYEENVCISPNRTLLVDMSSQLSSEHGYMSEILYNQDFPLPGSRRIFEENLLPLVSYDADSDSFRKVEELYSSNILHSPKVLFSCDVPNTRVTSSKKCIDFSNTLEAEFFQSKISDLVSPGAIGKYMSDLATLSSSISNGQENEDEVSPVEAVKHLEDFTQHDLPSDLSESSQKNCLLEQWEQTQKMQVSVVRADVNPIQSFCLMKKQDDKYHIVKPQKQDNAAQELFGENEYTVNKSTSNKTRRQLNLNYFDNSKPAHIKKIQVLVGETAAPEDISVPALHGSPVHKHNFQDNWGNLESMLPMINNSKEIADSFLLEQIDPLSPSLSSSCSSSSSSTLSVRMVSHSVTPVSPIALQISPTYKQHLCKIDKNGEGDSCKLDYQKPLFSSNLTSEHIVENTTTVLAERKHSDLKFGWKSSDNAEFPGVSFSQSSTSLLTPSSFSNTQSILVNLPSPTLHPLPILPSTLENLCSSDQGSHSSLSKLIMPNILPHDNADFNECNSKLGTDSSFENKIRKSGSFCHQKTHIVDLDSRRVSEKEISQSVNNLLLAKLPFNMESAASVYDVRNGGTSLGIGSLLETACHNQQSHAQKNLETFAKTENGIANLEHMKFVNLPAIARKSFYSFSNKTPLKADEEDIAENLSNSSSREFDADSLPTPPINFLDAATAVKTNTIKRSTKPRLGALKTASVGDVYSKFGDQATHYSNSDIPESDQESVCSRKNVVSPKKVVQKCIGSSACEIANYLTNMFLSEDSSLSCEQSELCQMTNDNSGSNTRYQDGGGVNEIFHLSSIEQPVGLCPFSLEVSNPNKCSVVGQGESTHQPQTSRVITQVGGQDCRNGLRAEHKDADKDRNSNASDWNSDVVFYISEPESRTKVNPPTSILPSSLKHLTTSKNHRATRPSSLSAEVNLEMKLRSNPGIIRNSNYDFSDHSRSPPYHSDPPGWISVPPHRTVSTPSCMDRESHIKAERTSDIYVIQQQNCDNVSQTGLRRMAAKSASMIFNNRTGLPTQSSPAPLKRKSGGRFDYDVSLLNTRAIKNAFSCSKLTCNVDDGGDDDNKKRTLSTSAPASTNCLLGNFEESILNGRIDPVGTVDGFTAEIGASGSFCPKHLHFPVSAFFFALSDDNAPSPYLGHINLESVGKKGYHIPRKGTVQVTLFNPNKTVVKMFVVVYDLSDMPVSSQTFIRQRTVFSPVDKNHTAPSYLRYLIHLRCASSQSGKIYLHTDIRLIFARHKLDIDAKTIPYELKSYTEGPQNPKYSPKK